MDDWRTDRIGRIRAGFAAKNPDGYQAVVKLVPKAPGADRELLFVNLTGVNGIVPIIDRQRKFSLTAAGYETEQRVLKQLSSRAQDYLPRVSSWVRSLSFAELVGASFAYADHDEAFAGEVWRLRRHFDSAAGA